MRALVTGAGGMLATAMVPALRQRGHDVIARDRRALDVTDPAAVLAEIMQERPDVVVQCAAYTAVDAAESEEELAFRVNASATRYVAEACHKTDALLVYPSTDYVFPGHNDRPYREDDETGPVNAYGRSKLAGEQASRAAGRFLVVRTSWLYGAGGRNFVDTIVKKAEAGEPLEVVSDQWGRPTWTGSLCDAVADLLERGREGVLHVTDVGPPVSWYALARAIVKLRASRCPVVPVSSERVARPARRAAYSVLDCSAAERAIGRSLPDWRESLATYLGVSRGAERAGAVERG